MALGASPATLMTLAMRQLVRLAVAGLAIGALLALGLSRLFGSVLYVIDTHDPLGYAVGLGVVFGACMLAAYVPSRLAAMVNPVDALREQ